MEDYIKHLGGCETCLEDVTALIFADKLALTAGEKDRIGKKIERLIFIDLLRTMIGKSVSSEKLYKTISAMSLFRIYNFIYSNIVPVAGFHRLKVVYNANGLIITEGDTIRFPYTEEEYTAILNKIYSGIDTGSDSTGKNKIADSNTQNEKVKVLMDILNTESASSGVPLAGAAAAKNMETPAPSVFKLYFLKKRRVMFASAASVVLLLITSLIMYNYFGTFYNDNTVIARGEVDHDFKMFLAHHYEKNIGTADQTKGYSHDGKRISDYDKMTKTIQKMSSVIGDLYLSLDLILEGAYPDDNRRSIVDLIREMKYIISSLEHISRRDQVAAVKKLFSVERTIETSEFNTVREVEEIRGAICSIIDDDLKNLVESRAYYNEMVEGAGFWYLMNARKYLRKNNPDERRLCGTPVRMLSERFEKRMVDEYQAKDASTRRDFLTFKGERIVATFFPRAAGKGVIYRLDSSKRRLQVYVQVEERKNLYWYAEINESEGNRGLMSGLKYGITR